MTRLTYLFTNTQREVETKINTSYILLHKHIWVSQYLKKIILSMFVWFILIILYYWRNDIFEVVPRLFSRENSVFIFKNCFFWGGFHKKSSILIPVFSIHCKYLTHQLQHAILLMVNHAMKKYQLLFLQKSISNKTTGPINLHRLFRCFPLWTKQQHYKFWLATL